MHSKSGREKRKGKDQIKHRKTLPLENVLFCFYNILRVVTIVSMKTVIMLCVWAMSQSVFLCREDLFRDFSSNMVDSY